jgi:hypothetical protein
MRIGWIAAVAVAALGGVVAGPAVAQSIVAWNAATESCRQFVAAHAVSIGYPATPDEVSARPNYNEGSNTLQVAFTLDAPTLKARGTCTLVGVGANWSVVSMTIRPVAP